MRRGWVGGCVVGVGGWVMESHSSLFGATDTLRHAHMPSARRPLPPPARVVRVSEYINLTTLNGGYLGSQCDEERGKMR